MRRPIFPLLLGVLVAAGTAGRAAEAFDGFASVQALARDLAARPYAPPARHVPAALARLSYDQYRGIRFKPEDAWWRAAGLPFQLQFFHPGYLFDRTVQIHEVVNGAARLIPFDQDWFDYGRLRVHGRAEEDMGYSGFRVHYRLNRPDYFDEVAVFQGASYFRAVARGLRYGLSARGLAIDPGGTGAEEFPAFEQFWIDRPGPASTRLIIYALLDSPSVSGAYRFVIEPGADTVMEIKVALYPRQAGRILGFAPLTSMFWHGENTPRPPEDFRPEVHDSDGLLIADAAGWLWRPLTDPAVPRLTVFPLDHLRGFGLLQRDRAFSHYEDIEACYQLRPSAWVEPTGDWGPGAVRLLELPTADETHDNIVACWIPAHPPVPGAPCEFSYKLHWYGSDADRPPLGCVQATYVIPTPGRPGWRRFIVDFTSPSLAALPTDAPPKPVISADDGAEVGAHSIEKNPFDGSWRVIIDCPSPPQPAAAAMLRCRLDDGNGALTETWTYPLNP